MKPLELELVLVETDSVLEVDDSIEVEEPELLSDNMRKRSKKSANHESRNTCINHRLRDMKRLI